MQSYEFEYPSVHFAHLNAHQLYAHVQLFIVTHKLQNSKDSNLTIIIQSGL
jgi:hypothetical protein